MNKFNLLKIVNPLLALSFIVQAATGIMMKFALGIDYMQQTALVHNFNGSIFVLLALTHLTLNWTWVKATFFKKKEEPVKQQQS